MSFTTDEIVVIGLIFIFLIVWWQKHNPVKSVNEHGRLLDDSVSMDSVKEILSKFELTCNEKLKLGYTEKLIESQLKILFQKNIENVITQYGLDGYSGQKIDFDLGNGALGVEIKLASAVFKASAQDKMVGQIQAYIKSKYDDDNLLLVIFCEKHHLSERAIMSGIKKRLDEMPVDVIFHEIDV